uniref:Fatty acid desaturase domain-containing protein n=1 Tax=Eutreptiella gymnastica TaxID=73025 RepID=A0A7S1IBP3_9EUGL
MFVVGHGCGHGTFSNYKWVNDLCGHICHAPLLVPFHGWRISHHKHHTNHNHVAKDHSWKPFSASEYEEFMTSNVYMWFRFHLPMLLLYPYYLLRESELYGFSGNHFNPWSSMFGPNDRLDAAISSLSVLGMLVFLFMNWSLNTLVECYFIPYLIFTAWLSMVTYLQHTDEKAIYYRDGAWTYYLGALSTVDRTYGSIIDHFHHNIETHVLHHIFFTKIPHYNLVKATDAVKHLIGDHYLKDDTWFPLALWNSVHTCHYVPDHGLVVKYEADPKWKGPRGKR